MTGKIQMTVPLVELDGDEMTRVLWQMVKTELLEPFLELKTEYYDLGLPRREQTGDAITSEAAHAIRRHGVGVKCATITPNAQRMEEYGLSQMWRSPNGTIRAILDGTVFRQPILTKVIRPYIPHWTKPITIARHSYGDIYRDTEYRVSGPGKAELLFTGQNGETFRETIHNFEGPGILQGCFNKDDSIEHFAAACFEYALATRQDLWFSAKDTIMKQYDGRFKEVFQDLYDSTYRAAFAQAGITYFYTLIDDAVARILRSQGGMVWALKNYDGDVMSDLVSTAFGSLAMMTSVLVSADGCYEFEAAHGTITQHYYRHRKGEKTSSNPVATIFAWSGALRQRGKLDGNAPLIRFADALEQATLETIESGTMTADLAHLSTRPAHAVDSETFLSAIRRALTDKLQ